MFKKIDDILKGGDAKITKMFEMMGRWDKTTQNLPPIIERLQTLEKVHKQSANVVERVKSLQDQQKIIKNTLEDNQKILEQVLLPICVPLFFSLLSWF